MRRPDDLPSVVAPEPFEAPIQAVVVPRGDLERCGPIVDQVLGALEGASFKRIVLLGSAPGARWSGAALPRESELTTPKGTCHLDAEALSLLEGYAPFSRAEVKSFDSELGELLVEALQRRWPAALLLPVLVGSVGEDDRLRIGHTLRHVLDERTLLVAAAALPQLEGDVGALLDRSGEASVGGSGDFDALGVLHAALGPGDRGVLVSRPSGDGCVGVLFPGRWPAVASLGPEDRRALGRIAEEGVAAAVHGRLAPPLGELSPRLRQGGGAFVTLTERKRLRGCMGRLSSDSVAGAVAHAARMAAQSDPRFNPLRPDDLARIELEISVLGPFEAIASPADFEPGRHGLLLTSGFHRGLLLPQVATEHSLGRAEFLEALANKAGLPPGGWKDAKLERFGVEAFAPRPI